MDSFDKAVNNILKILIKEGASDFRSIDNIVNSKIAEIKKRNSTDMDSFMAESEARYRAGEELVNKFVENLKEISKSTTVKESFSDQASNAWDALKQGGSELWSKVAPEIANTQEYLADLAVENIGTIVRQTIGDEYVDEIRNQLSENMIYKIIAILEPTGVMSWPYLAKAKEEYEAHIGTEEEGIYQLNLLAAQISVIPGVRMPLAILTLPFRLVFGFPARVLGKIFGISGLRSIGLALTEKIKLPFTKSAAVKKGAEALQKAPVNSKIGKLSKIPASNAIKKLPQKAVKSETAMAKTASQKVINATKKTSKGVSSGLTAAGKAGVVGAKTATVIGSGDIPQTLKDWQKTGEGFFDKKLKDGGTLGKFPKFREISTQRF